ncbi:MULTISPECIES: ABC transporter permease subunit [unclassified Microbacterium]|uniref:PhnE/PtxC family ABC transporter permease n=1 Tax=unclassified Microbacterium TaxID=2609290 RepID=UPI000AAE15A7|nr:MULTISPECIES: ABC transporter permease subunit [unclassified Microbacterium]MBN9215380.1 ABC transporter permease subunit [Microbacterium sp.]
MTAVLSAPPQPSAARLQAIKRPRPLTATVVSYSVIAGIAILGIWSFAALDYSFKSLETTFANLSRFIGMATPMQWPGWNVVGTRQPDGTTTFVTEWVGIEPILDTFGSIAITLALVIAGTALAAVLSIPVAYGAARNTAPGRVALAISRFIGVVMRAIPDVVFVVFLAFLWFNSGTLPAIVAIGLHSVGMISKMFADAVEQIDEGPRLAIRAAGGSKSQEFWSGVVPQALPAWIAVTLHRADINLRGTVILGVVGVAGLGYDLDEALHAGPAGMRRVIPIVLIIIALCIVFEIISSLIRARLLGVRPTGRGTGDTVVRALAKRSSRLAASIDRNGASSDEVARAARIEAVMHRPWDRGRVLTTAWIWLGILIVVWAFVYAGPDLARLVSGWRFDQVVNAELDRAIWPPNFGTRDVGTVLAAVGTTLQVAFAATLMGALISAFVGPLSARNVAPNGGVRNLFRGIALVLRAIPDLVVAIIFIIATGFGPQAAALALGIGGVGLLAKLVGDSMEEVPNGPERAVGAAGGSRTQVFFASTLPMSVPSTVSHLMYLLEQNVRSATLLGIVGAGGIGFLLLNALQGRHFDQVFAYVLVIIAMVVVVETAAILIRRALK